MIAVFGLYSGLAKRAGCRKRLFFEGVGVCFGWADWEFLAFSFHRLWNGIAYSKGTAKNAETFYVNRLKPLLRLHPALIRPFSFLNCVFEDTRKTQRKFYS